MNQSTSHVTGKSISRAWNFHHAHTLSDIQKYYIPYIRSQKHTTRMMWNASIYNFIYRRCTADDVALLTSDNKSLQDYIVSLFMDDSVEYSHTIFGMAFHYSPPKFYSRKNIKHYVGEIFKTFYEAGGDCGFMRYLEGLLKIKQGTLLDINHT